MVIQLHTPFCLTDAFPTAQFNAAKLLSFLSVSKLFKWYATSQLLTFGLRIFLYTLHALAVSETQYLLSRDESPHKLF